MPVLLVGWALMGLGCASRTTIPPQIPKDPLFKLSQANDYLQKKQCDRALQLYNEVLPVIEEQEGIAPYQVAEIYHFKGLSLVCLGQYEAALQTFQKALAIEPLYYPAKNAMGITYTEMGRYQDAERIFLELLKVPDFPQAAVYFNLAKLYVDQDQWTRSMFVARKAVELAPDELGPRLLYAQILEHLGLTKEAISQYRTIAKKWPMNLETLYHLARLYENQSQFCEAKRYYLRILEADPVGPYAKEATVKLQTLPCSQPILVVPPKPPEKKDGPPPG